MANRALTLSAKEISKAVDNAVKLVGEMGAKNIDEQVGIAL
jgi:hypothetical protein